MTALASAPGVGLLLEVEGLVKTYPRRGRSAAVEALRGLSFAVRAGELFGLLGPNGAGKSTLLGCLSTLVRPTSGRIVVGGHDLARSPTEVKRRIAVVPQRRNLDQALSVREILTYHARYFGLPAAEREARADRLLAEMSIGDKAHARPGTLSGGTQQRVLIARALMHDPHLLLLDEPTTGLDPQARRSLWRTLGELHRRGLTIILTTHNMEEAEALCQRLAVIDDGRILALDAPAALKRTLPGLEVLDLAVRSARPLAPRLSVIAGVVRVEALGAVGGDGGGERLRLYVDAPSGIVDRVIQAARHEAACVDHVSLSAPSLEDVYLHLTGKELRE
jgi:ABC-2 type transport system ATP-binding protein